MARPRKVSHADWSTQWGDLIGRALGQGLAEGLQGAFARVRTELEPVGLELARLLADEVRLEQQTAETLAELEARRCEEEGCFARPVARNLCRKHYARQMYQERKKRSSVREPRRNGGRVPSVGEGEEMSVKKVVAAVPPVVRRRKNGEEEHPRPQLTVVPSAPPAEQGKAEPVLLEQVARFLGVKASK